MSDALYKKGREIIFHNIILQYSIRHFRQVYIFSKKHCAFFLDIVSHVLRLQKPLFANLDFEYT